MWPAAGCSTRLMLRRRDEQRVIGRERVYDRLRDDVVGGPVKQPHAVVGEIRDRVDRFLEREPARAAHELPGRDRFVAVHAAAEREAHRILGAVVRPRRDDAGAVHQGGMRDVELHRHVAAAGDPGDGDGTGGDADRRQTGWRRRFASAASRQRDGQRQRTDLPPDSSRHSFPRSHVETIVTETRRFVHPDARTADDLRGLRAKATFSAVAPAPPCVHPCRVGTTRGIPQRNMAPVFRARCRGRSTCTRRRTTCRSGRFPRTSA